MAIDDLTEEAFFDLYQKNPKVRGLVDDIQKRYHVHASQKGKPDYNEANISLATKEAKEAVKRLLAQQKPQEKASVASGIFSGRGSYAAGLAAVLILVASASLGMPYVPPLY